MQRQSRFTTVCIKENPNDFRPNLAKGIVLGNQGKNAEALPLLKAAEASAPVQVKAKLQSLIAKVEAGQAPSSPPTQGPK
jgi:hypothetical protein